MHITILTMGSRGDVQPFIALAVGLQQAGHTVRLVTHENFKSDIQRHGIEFALIGGNPQEALESEAGQAMMQSKNPIEFARRMAEAFEPILEAAMQDAWKACQGTDVIIGASVAFWGFDIAQKLDVPFYMATLQPFPPTTSLPNAVMPPQLERLGGFYNRLTYTLVGQVLWQPLRKPINRFRQLTLHEPPLKFWQTPLGRMEQQQIHFLNGFSSAVIPQPTDWPENAHITGYWFLDPPADFTPPPDLVEFLQSGTPPVYIGFGSMSGKISEITAEIALAAFAKTQQRGIFLTGWGGIRNADLPDTVFKLDYIPHSWLFPQMACIVHHGGAGTTAATFRAGVPGVIVPFSADQPFWAYRAAKLGVSPPMISRKNLTVDVLVEAINRAVHDQTIRDRAAALGEKIRSENGVAQAVEIVQQTMNERL